VRGSITRLMRKQGCGFILGEDGCEVYFDQSATKGLDVGRFFVGLWVEFDIQYGFERLRAVDIRLLGDRTGATGALSGAQPS